MVTQHFQGGSWPPGECKPCVHGRFVSTPVPANTKQNTPNQPLCWSVNVVEGGRQHLPRSFLSSEVTAGRSAAVPEGRFPRLPTWGSGPDRSLRPQAGRWVPVTAFSGQDTPRAVRSKDGTHPMKSEVI